uniref:Uncharacterized protein n=1 Tax=Arundo donax TaxID=35708 RepID=A0A0A9KKM2_ARUDO
MIKNDHAVDCGENIATKLPDCRLLKIALINLSYCGHHMNSDSSGLLTPRLISDRSMTGGQQPQLIEMYYFL